MNSKQCADEAIEKQRLMGVNVRRLLSFYSMIGWLSSCQVLMKRNLLSKLMMGVYTFYRIETSKTLEVFGGRLFLSTVDGSFSYIS